MWVHQIRCSPNQERLGVHEKNNRRKKIEELSEASKVPIEQMFNNHENCIEEWCFNTRESEERNTYNETDDEFLCKQNDNQIYNLLKKTIFPFQTAEVLRESLHMFDTQEN